MAFAGFPREGLAFLADLARNNERAWFHAHREEYDAYVLEPARDLVEALGEELARFAPDVHAEPTVGGSIMRIARDTRFSKNKTPYKPHLDLWFWEGDGPSRTQPGYWFRLTPKRLLLGVGMHRFEREVLERYREAVVDPKRGQALAKAVAAVERAGGDVGGANYKRVPRGYDTEHERAPLLLHDGLYAGLELPVPRELPTPRFAKFCAERYKRFTPLQEWLVDLLT
ncbi:MAG TPA: DUF2461 domain-containing protein [Gaiellaceae bacterium]|nr:DUF2461 domain-containing protein [Gaiellaceae bacterium]